MKQAKFNLVILIASLSLGASLLSACDSPVTRSESTAPPRSPDTTSTRREKKVESYQAPVQLAQLKDSAVKESSGLVASRRALGLFWTHNDSGDGPLLFAFDPEGNKRGVWRVTGAEAQDWEDIAMGPGPQRGQPYLYIGDIGDNGRQREHLTIYRVSEPTIGPVDKASSPSNPQATAPAEAIRLKYPAGKHDAEALLVHPVSGDLYIVTKTTEPTAVVYKASAPLSTTTVTQLVRLGTISPPSLFGSLITGGDIAPDGSRLVLCNYISAYELRLPDDQDKFDTIWKAPMTTINLGTRQQGEAICYRLDSQAVLATSEKRPTPLIEVVRAAP